MTKSKTVVVWGGEDILTSSIELLLAAKKDWKVVSVSSKKDLDVLIPDYESTQAEIVIIHRVCGNDSSNFPLQLLQAHPAIKVITISLENNVLDVYTKQNILVKRVSDLIGVIETEL